MTLLLSNKSVLDERVEAIARFVQETGRDPQVGLDTSSASEMDDMTAVRIQWFLNIKASIRMKWIRFCLASISSSI